MADVEKAEPEYVPADYVAPADADEQAKGGRWSQCCDWPLAFRDGLNGIPPRSEPRGLHSSGPRSRSYTSPSPRKITSCVSSTPLAFRAHPTTQ